MTSDDKDAALGRFSESGHFLSQIRAFPASDAGFSPRKSRRLRRVMTNLFTGSRLFSATNCGATSKRIFGGLGLRVVRVQVVARFEDPALIKRILEQWDRSAGKRRRPWGRWPQRHHNGNGRALRSRVYGAPASLRADPMPCRFSIWTLSCLPEPGPLFDNEDPPERGFRNWPSPFC